MIKVPLRTRLAISLRGTVSLMRRPGRVLLTFAIAFLVVSFFVWLPNVGLLFELGKLPTLSYWDKIKVFFEGLGGLLTNFMEAQAIAILLVALLVGINVALLVAIGSSRLSNARAGGATLLALFGAGCAACGTSIFAPLIASLGAATSIGFVERVGLAANLVAIGLLSYSIYRLGLQAK